MRKRKKILVIFGTRPEAIKMAPIIKELTQHPEIEYKVCVTGQHREMLDQVLTFFEIVPDFDLNIMKSGQDLFDITANTLISFKKILHQYRPDLIFVQGDTTTAFVCALAGFYNKTKIIHVEAGLRSGQKHSPFPEEINRKMISQIADYHFAPTKNAVRSLANEKITGNVFEVGNTVIDALQLGLKMVKIREKEYLTCFRNVDFSKKIILVTAHRRESFGTEFKNICRAIKQIAQKFKNVQIIYPVHPNPNVQKPVNEILSKCAGVSLIEPLDYPKLIWLMSKSYLILTDSGGIQEEAPSLGKPVIVLRNVTERTEGINAGTAILVGTSQKKIVEETSKLLNNETIYKKMASASNPYGDGLAAKRIISYLKKTNEL